MQDKKWFVLDSKGSISGPFSKEDINAKSLPSTTLIWSRGQSDWFSFEKWKQFISEFHGNPVLPMAKPNETIQTPPSFRVWKLKIAGKPSEKIYSYDSMMEFLKNYENIKDILIWTDGYTEWKEVFQIHKIMDELGVSRREHPRVPIMGIIKCENAKGSFDYKVLSISIGGLGVTDAHSITIGDKFKATIKSPNLFSLLHATVEVVYAGPDGYAGLKFLGMDSESKSLIIEYINKFSNNK